MPSKEQQEPLGIDCVVMYIEGTPLFVKAKSERAKTLFTMWGVGDEVVGIRVPDDPMDLVMSMPKHWIMAVENLEPRAGGEMFLIQEIPLPQPRLVLH